MQSPLFYYDLADFIFVSSILMVISWHRNFSFSNHPKFVNLVIIVISTWGFDRIILGNQARKVTQTIVTRNNLVWKLACDYYSCYCKTSSLVPDSTVCAKIFVSVVHYLCHLKSNDITGQRKTNNKEKHFYPWLTLFKFKLSCTWLILENSKYLLQILCIYCTNWLRVISCHEQINRLLVVIHHENICKLASLRFLNLNLE